MKVLYYDCFAGISGDMHLAAMIDSGIDPQFLREELQKLPFADDFSLEIAKEKRNGIKGTKVTVHSREKGHPHRHLEDITEIIVNSGFNENVKRRSLDMFAIIAEAEAHVHDCTIGEVHFHEVGAVDSIVDIVGAAICIDHLCVDKIESSPVELGGGFTRCDHGLLPVPAPATAEIVKGIPVTGGAEPYEMTTPTGAAILAHSVHTFTKKAQLTIHKTGYGIGTRDTATPNMLRIFLGEIECDTEGSREAKACHE